jgi:hypothetical protein
VQSRLAWWHLDHGSAGGRRELHQIREVEKSGLSRVLRLNALLRTTGRPQVVHSVAVDLRRVSSVLAPTDPSPPMNYDQALGTLIEDLHQRGLAAAIGPAPGTPS